MLNHDYFGNIDCSNFKDVDVVWEQTIKVNGKEVDVTLWAKETDWSADKIETLDKYAKHCQNLAKLDEIARKHLIAYLTEDDEYMNFHIEELGNDSDVIKTLLKDSKKPTPVTFAQAMQLHSVSFWLDGQFNFDYMIDPEYSDQILCVKHDVDAIFEDIAWES